ncbi:MAG: DUF2339 domain-containing protein, partial [Roseimicrobium sp.]
MEVLGFFVLLVLFVLVAVVPIAAIVIARGARDRAAAAEHRLESLRSVLSDRQNDLLTRLSRLEARVGTGTGTSTGTVKEEVTPLAAAVVAASAAATPPAAKAAETVTLEKEKVPSVVPPTSLGGIPLVPVDEVEEKKEVAPAPEPVKPAVVTSPASSSLPPPLPSALMAAKVPMHSVSPVEAPVVPARAYVPTTVPPPPSLTPPPLVAAKESVVTPRVAVPPTPSASPTSNASTLEQFMGVKLFAWVGGLALFLGIVFFIKLSMEKGWISEQARIAIGYTLGLGLVAGGWVINSRKLYTVLGQTLCATGVVVLYGVTFAAHSYYEFPAFTPTVTFGVMSAITIGAFLLAVRMDAQVVAILGMLGGFLTPILCSTGQDRPFALFGYI